MIDRENLGRRLFDLVFPIHDDEDFDTVGYLYINAAETLVREALASIGKRLIQRDHGDLPLMPGATWEEVSVGRIHTEIDALIRERDEARGRTTVLEKLFDETNDDYNYLATVLEEHGATLAAVEEIGWRAIEQRDTARFFLGKVEQLRTHAEAKLTTITALARGLVSSLPRCQYFAVGDDLSESESCGLPATRRGACNPTDSYCCDDHKCRHACPEVKWAAPLRALMQAVSEGEVKT